MDVKFIGENLQHANTIYSDKKRSLRYSYNFDYFLFVIMPQKKNLRNFDDMPVIIFKNRIIIALLCAAMLLMGGCKKTVENISTPTLQQYFEDNILNKNFVVEFATDSSVNKTSDYAGYTFVLTKTTSYYDGPMTGTKAGIVYSGTWASNEDYSKLVISLNSPTPPVEFNFINRAWKFTQKNLPIMELAPWGTTDPKVLHMRRL